MDLQEKALKNSHLGIYIHVPFCGTSCDFCAFYQEKPHRKDVERYLWGIEEEMKRVVPRGPVETVFMGGGTPGLLSAKDFESVGTALVEHLGELPKEWSVEMAPATVKRDKLEVMKALGVNRISMGVQSFDDNLLGELGRTHSVKQVYKAYELIREVGFRNVNLDLIFAIPRQGMEQWEADMGEAMRLEPEHISTYCLTFEEDTALYVKLSQGKLTIDEEKERAMYQRTWEVLDRGGYKQYEISNFAKEGYACIHNINTWKMQEWIGVGPSASSQYKGRRYTNVHSLDEWLEGLEKHEPKYVDEVALTEDVLAMDSIIFGLRMNAGVDMAGLSERFKNVDLNKYADLMTRLEEEGYLKREGDRVFLTEAGRLVADQVGSEVMDV